MIKALSLWEPWASLIAAGAKTIETRSWSTSYRGPLAIHAAKRKVRVGEWGTIYMTPSSSLPHRVCRIAFLLSRSSLGCFRLGLRPVRQHDIRYPVQCGRDARLPHAVNSFQVMRRPTRARSASVGSVRRSVVALFRNGTGRFVVGRPEQCPRQRGVPGVASLSMPFRLEISEPGELRYLDPEDGAERSLGDGYSGNGPGGGANNPAMITVHDVGPIPPGVYVMSGPYKKHQPIPPGPWNGNLIGAFAPTDNTIVLTPAPGTVTYGRLAFMVHGDTIYPDRRASKGCPVRPPDQRQDLVELGIEQGDTLLDVVIKQPPLPEAL